MGVISDEAIRERAYHIWEREGRPHGRDFEHWVRAQVELIAEGSTNRSAQAAAVARPRVANPKGTTRNAKRATAKSSSSNAARVVRIKKPA